MLLSAIKRTDSLSYFIIFFWTVVLSILVVFASQHPILAHELYPGKVQQIIYNYSENTFYINFLRIFYFVLIFLNGIYFNRIVIKYNILTDAGNLPFMFYIAFNVPIMVYFTTTIHLVICMSFFLLSFDLLLKTAEINKNTTIFFSVGILFSLCSLIYPPVIFLVPFIIYGQVSFRHFSLRELLFILLGIALPYGYLLSVLYLRNISISDYILNIKAGFQFIEVFRYTNIDLFMVLFIVLFYILNTVYALNVYSKIKVIRRKFLSLSFIMFLNILLLLIFIKSVGLEMSIFISIPSSILFSIYYTLCKNSFVNRLLFMVQVFLFPVIWIIQ